MSPVFLYFMKQAVGEGGAAFLYTSSSTACDTVQLIWPPTFLFLDDLFPIDFIYFQSDISTKVSTLISTLL